MALSTKADFLDDIAEFFLDFSNLKQFKKSRVGILAQNISVITKLASSLASEMFVELARENEND